jgi:hypothetical protein
MGDDPVWWRITRERLGHPFASDLGGCRVRRLLDASRPSGGAPRWTVQVGDIDIGADIAGSHVVITVRDSGVGISPELMPHVFDIRAVTR